MFTSPLTPIQQYRTVSAATAVSQASPHELVVMLYDAAIAAVLQARHALATGDHDTRRGSIAKAMRLVDEGLKAAIQPAGSEQLEQNLHALYDHMVQRLLQANIQQADAPLEETARLLGELRSAWAEVSPGRRSNTTPS